MFKKLFRAFRTLLLLFVSVALVAIALSILPRQFFIAPEVCDAGFEEIYVVNHGYHTGIVIQRGTPEFEWLDSLNAPAKYPAFEIGWGDRDFYMARGEDFFLGAKALFTPTDAVMHIVGLPAGDPSEIFGSANVGSAVVCSEDCVKLSEFMVKSFRQAPSQSPVLDRGLYGGWSAFYDAVGTYSIIYTCNSWTAEAMDIAGLGAPIWGGTAQSIMYHLPDHSMQP